MANDRLHEIIAEIGVLHKYILEKGMIKDLESVENYINSYPSDTKEHYLKLLLQYYFQENDLENCQKLLLQGFKFDMRMEDVAEAFTNIKDDSRNVIEFFEENVVFLKDNNYTLPLKKIYEYYKENPQYHNLLETPLDLIKRNRYVCAYAFKNQDYEFSDFFINKELLVSLQRDLPHLFK